MRCLLVLSTCLLLASCTPQPHSTSILDQDPLPVGDFSFTERGGRTVSRRDLLGKVWIGSFIFTRCAGPCSQVSGAMSRLQKELANEDDVLLVTFTVDPEHYTPKVLTAY